MLEKSSLPLFTKKGTKTPLNFHLYHTFISLPTISNLQKFNLFLPENFSTILLDKQYFLNNRHIYLKFIINISFNYIFFYLDKVLILTYPRNTCNNYDLYIYSYMDLPGHSHVGRVIGDLCLSSTYT